MKMITAILIGAGDRGANAYASYAINNPGTIKFVAVADKNEEKRKKIIESQKMVQCPQCGVHFVEVDGVWFNGLMYCSQACADKAKESKS